MRSNWKPICLPPGIPIPATVLNLAADSTKWLSLEIKKYLPESADRATVEFIARYKIGGRAGRLREVSRFVREDGKWFYVDGEVVNTAKD